MSIRNIGYLAIILVGGVFLAFAPPARAINETVTVTARAKDDPQHNPSDIEGHFTTSPNSDSDEIDVVNSNVKGEGAGVYNDPVNDGAMLTVTQQSGPVEVTVEGRKGIGAIYWATVLPTLGGGRSGSGGDPTLWADVQDVTTPGVLVLQDLISGATQSNSGNGASPTLYCQAAPDDHLGDVDFWLTGIGSGTYDWQITQSGNAIASGTLSAASISATQNDLPSGAYVLVVSPESSSGGSGSSQVIYQINFVVITIDISGDNNDDGVVDARDEQVKTTMPIVLLEKHGTRDATQTLTIHQVAVAEAFSAILKKSGSGTLKVTKASDGSTILATSGNTSADISSALAGGDLSIKADGATLGAITLTLSVTVGGQAMNDGIALKVVNADVIFRCGSNTLAALCNCNVTHGGIDAGNGNIHDLGFNGPETITFQAFYNGDVNPAHPTQRRAWLDRGNYMAGRIWAQVYDNMSSQAYENPVSPQPWNLFTSSDDYGTTNCLEWANRQFRHAIIQVSNQLQDPAQVAAFQAAYFANGRLKVIASPVLLKGPQAPVGQSVNYINALVTAGAWRADSDGASKSQWNNTWEGTYYDFYPGYYGTPIDQVPAIVIAAGDLYSEPQLNTYTPSSYLTTSIFFKEVPF